MNILLDINVLEFLNQKLSEMAIFKKKILSVHVTQQELLMSVCVRACMVCVCVCVCVCVRVCVCIR